MTIEKKLKNFKKTQAGYINPLCINLFKNVVDKKVINKLSKKELDTVCNIIKKI
jgi:hypothetical protein